MRIPFLPWGGGGVRIVSVGRICFQKGFDLIVAIARLVSVGRVSFEKGLDMIPSIAKGISYKQVPFEWDVIGGATTEVMAAHQELVHQNGMDGVVKFLGQMENPMPYVAAADIVVIPSRFEGWGMTLSEALVLGKPVVATDLPVFREQVKNGVNGLLVPLEVNAFAEAIIRLINNPDLRVQLSKAAIDYPFTKDEVVNEFAELLK